MAWIYLILGGFCEFGFTAFLKMSENFTKPLPSIGFFILASVSYLFLYLAMRTLPMGTAYAVWTGMGAVGVAIMGIILFKESMDWIRLLSITLVILGIIGLKLTDNN